MTPVNPPAKDVKNNPSVSPAPAAKPTAANAKPVSTSVTQKSPPVKSLVIQKSPKPPKVKIDGNLRAQRIFGILIWAVFTIQPLFTWHYIGWRSLLVYPLCIPMLIHGIRKFNAPEKIKEDKPEEEKKDDKDKKEGDDKKEDDSDKKDSDEKKE